MDLGHGNSLCNDRDVLKKRPKKRSIEQVYDFTNKTSKKSYALMSCVMRKHIYDKAIDIESDRIISPRMINFVVKRKVSRIGYKLNKYKEDNDDREGFVEIKSRKEADSLNLKYPYLIISFSHSRQCRLYSYDYMHYSYTREFGSINQSNN